MTTNTPVALNDLQETCKFTLKTLEKIVAEAKIEPVQVLPFGKRTLKFYDRDAVLKAVEAHSSRKIPAKESPEVPLELITAMKESSTKVQQAVTDLTELVKLQTEENKTMAASMKSLEQQNAQLFQCLIQRMETVDSLSRTMTGMFETLLMRVDKLDEKRLNTESEHRLLLDLILQGISEIQNPGSKPAEKPAVPTVESLKLAGASAAETPVVPVKVPKTLKLTKSKICIVGLIPSQEQLIRKEYNDYFDIKCYESGNAKGRSFRSVASSSDLVVAMTSFINHGIEDCVTASSGKLVRLPGGMSSLRSKLNELKPSNIQVS